MRVISTGVFVQDKITARKVLETLFLRGYKISHSTFFAEKTDEKVKIVPMDSLVKLRYYNAIDSFKFDEIHLPANIQKDWEDLARSRLRDLNSVVKIYTR